MINNICITSGNTSMWYLGTLKLQGSDDYTYTAVDSITYKFEPFTYSDGTTESLQGIEVICATATSFYPSEIQQVLRDIYTQTSVRRTICAFILGNPHKDSTLWQRGYMDCQYVKNGTYEFSNYTGSQNSGMSVSVDIDASTVTLSRRNTQHKFILGKSKDSRASMVGSAIVLGRSVLGWLCRCRYPRSYVVTIIHIKEEFIWSATFNRVVSAMA